MAITSTDVPENGYTVRYYSDGAVAYFKYGTLRRVEGPLCVGPKDREARVKAFVPDVLYEHAKMYFSKSAAEAMIRAYGDTVDNWVGAAISYRPDKPMPMDSVSYLLRRTRGVPWRSEDMRALASTEPTPFIWERRLSPIEMLYMWCWSQDKRLGSWMMTGHSRGAKEWHELRAGLAKIAGIRWIDKLKTSDNEELLRHARIFIANRLSWDE